MPKSQISNFDDLTVYRFYFGKIRKIELLDSLFNAKKVEAKEILENFRDKKILVVGDLMLDKFIFGDTTKISPEAPVPIIEVRDQKFMLGGAGNVSNNLRALGAEVFVSGVVGDDDEGREILNELRNSGINCGIFTDKRPTTVKTRVVSKRQHLIRIDRESKELINEVIENKILGYAESIEFDAVVFSDYMKGVLTPKILNGFKEFQKKMIIGPKINFSLDYNKTILIANQEKISDLIKIKILNDTSLKNAGFNLTSRLGCEAVIMTRGSEGMAVFDGEISKIQAFGTEAYDTTGVADTVMAAFTLALASSGSIIDSAKIANYAAGIKVRKIGTAVVTKEEIEKILL